MCIQPIHMPARDCPLWTFTITTSCSSQVLSPPEERQPLISKVSKNLSEPGGLQGIQALKPIYKAASVHSEHLCMQSQAVTAGMGKDCASLGKTVGKCSVSWNLVCLRYLSEANMTSSH